MKEVLLSSKFVFKKDRGGQFMFNLVANNGRIVLTGERYKSKASNGEAIGRSQIYAGPSGCTGGVSSIKRCAPAGKIEDLT